MHPRLTAQMMCACRRSRARWSVPFGVETSTVSSQAGAPAGTRFWNHDLPSAPSGNRCSSAGRRPAVRRIGPAIPR